MVNIKLVLVQILSDKISIFKTKVKLADTDLEKESYLKLVSEYEAILEKLLAMEDSLFEGEKQNG